MMSWCNNKQHTIKKGLVNAYKNVNEKKYYTQLYVYLFL